MKVLSAQLCLIICNPTDWRPPGSSVHGIFQARIVEWVAIPSSRGSSWPRDRTWAFCIAGWFFTVCFARQSLFCGGCAWPLFLTAQALYESFEQQWSDWGRELLDQVIFPIWITKSGFGGGGGVYRPTSEECLQKTFRYNRKEHKVLCPMSESPSGKREGFQDNATGKKGKFITDSSQGPLPHPTQWCRSESPEPKLLHKFIGWAHALGISGLVTSLQSNFIGQNFHMGGTFLGVSAQFLIS